MMVTVVIAAAAMPAPVAAIGNPEHALDRAHRAADPGADGAANDAADRTGDPIAFIGAFLRAAHDTLRMAELRDRQQGKSDAPQPQAGAWRACRPATAAALVLMFFM